MTERRLGMGAGGGGRWMGGGVEVGVGWRQR